MIRSIKLLVFIMGMGHISICFAAEQDSIQSDSSKVNTFMFHAGMDWYYAYNFINPKIDQVPYYVSMNENHKINLNLLYVDLKYTGKRIRARFLPAIGSFMRSNSASEKGIFKNMLESNIGFKPFKNRNLWVDAGVLGSPYTNENPFSQEHLTYTRSLSAEYVPYYLAGVKMSYSVNEKLKAFLYVLNGWQQIHDLNKNKSIGTQLEYKPNPKSTLNWNTYIGNEKSELRPEFGMRYFTDLYWVYNVDGKFSLATCAYVGLQETKGINTNELNSWWQANFAMRYRTKKWGAVVGRIEYFHDPNMMMVLPVTNELGFKCASYSVGYSISFLSNIMVRVEYKDLISFNSAVFINSEGNHVRNSRLFTGGLTLWF